MLKDDDAKRLINKMRIFYGKKFFEQWAKVSDDDLISGVLEVLGDLNSEQLKRGYERMKQETWCPSLPEFRAWCVQGGDWLTEYEAWIQALDWDGSNRQTAISNFAKEALLTLKTAYPQTANTETQCKAFRDIYIRKINEAKQQGLKQEIIPEQRCIVVKDNHQPAPAPPPPEFKNLMRKMGVYKEVAV